MTIQFDRHGNPIPYATVKMSGIKFKSEFSEIPDVNQRTQLIRRLEQYIDDFFSQISPDNWTQWFGGSYTTNKEYPNDIDLVNFVDYNSLDSSFPNIQSFLTQRSKPKYSVDGYLVPLFDINDPRHHITKDRTDYWNDWFGHDRNRNPKAVIEVVQK